MKTTINHSPGRYVRSRREAETIIAQGSTHPESDGVVRAMRTGGEFSRLGAHVAVEVIRRGLICRQLVRCCMCVALDHGTSVDVGNELTAEKYERRAIELVDQWQAGQVHGVTGQRYPELGPESDREQRSGEWDQVAKELGDDWQDEHDAAQDRPRVARSLRWWGMMNRAMRNKLERGECVDLSDCKRDEATGYFIVPPDVWQEDVDYCDSRTESWVHSIGRSKTGVIHASLGNELYQNEAYECLWLR